MAEEPGTPGAMSWPVLSGMMEKVNIVAKNRTDCGPENGRINL